MCGIAGLISDAAVAPDGVADLVRGMCDGQRHRGPDDIGVVVNENACLGSIRLSIIDLSDAGHMPMGDAAGRWWITYNGEVYNFRELREELVALGHAFTSQTDTEVVLHAFMEWGEQSLHRFVGMFAFAIHDRDGGRVHLVRDRYGIKPLYYRRHGDGIAFASEIKGVRLPDPELEVDRRSLIEWSLHRNVDILTPDTLLVGIHSVLPGEIVTIEGGEIERHPFYRPTDFVDPETYARYRQASPDDVVAEIRASLDRAVEQRLIADVPVGTLCSGGLDSSLVTAIAAEHTRDLTVFNVAIEGNSELDESVFARQLAEHLGLRFISFPLNGEIFRRELPRVVLQCDLPLTHPNSVAYHLISRVARENGIIVLLSGEGADELFGGYDRYAKTARVLRVKPLLELLPDRWRSRFELLAFASAGIPLTMHARELVPFTAKLTDGFARQEWQATCERAYGFVRRDADRVLLGSMLADLSDFLTPLLRRLDRTSMANSIECRVPFLDHRLVHQAINLPLDYRIGKRANKWVLRKIAADYLPPTIWKRKKTGFPLPLADYLEPLVSVEVFRGGFCEGEIGLRRDVLRDFLDEWRRNVQGFFSILCLEIWGRLIVHGEPLEDVEALLDRVSGAGTVSQAATVAG